ncbi:hypothetical protein PVAP13_9NG040273 [Panicum virgatum]|uniref:Uncharacterized protein n=1 Tax=Panicum virgatum TaxID=38727 RepID=A0A8T0MCT1_PANVG|nr:hypothetical protein PVAP13_9NG040273 [Panicum virgatum]
MRSRPGGATASKAATHRNGCAPRPRQRSGVGDSIGRWGLAEDEVGPWGLPDYASAARRKQKNPERWEPHGLRFASSLKLTARRVSDLPSIKVRSRGGARNLFFYY